ncbi:MAG: DUF1295 domain-containing protein [Deferrisomatales bacterium]|nr:DUF1295 domain-containing protein [Deferrisomatales bacterium]
MLETLGLSALAVFLYMCGFFVASLIAKNNGVVDVAWGGGFVLVAVVTFLRYVEVHPRQLLVLFLVAAWGLRLAAHIHARNRGQGEDFRYRKWREEWGEGFVLRSFLQIYMLQGALLLVVATPIWVVNHDPGGGLGWLDWIGAAIWAVGFGFEAVGDWQLLRFMGDPDNQGKIMQTGLWRYTRHPNYFGEATLWWGMFLIALGAPHGWLSVVSPLTIAFLLLKVSGIPMLEERWKGDAEFEAYKSRTNALLPWFPKG